MTRIAKALEIVRLAKELGNYDSNVIGMAAEIISEDAYGMTKASRGAKTLDGYWTVNGSSESVQVKGWSCRRIETYLGGTFFRVEAVNGPKNLLVILFFADPAEYEVLYAGPTDAVGTVEKNGKKRVIRFDHLKSKSEIDAILRKIKSIREARSQTLSDHISTD